MTPTKNLPVLCSNKIRQARRTMQRRLYTQRMCPLPIQRKKGDLKGSHRPRYRDDSRGLLRPVSRLVPGRERLTWIVTQIERIASKSLSSVTLGATVQMNCTTYETATDPFATKSVRKSGCNIGGQTVRSAETRATTRRDYVSLDFGRGSAIPIKGFRLKRDSFSRFVVPRTALGITHRQQGDG
jgi:hypothetical protein